MLHYLLSFSHKMPCISLFLSFLARMIFMFYMEDPPPAFKGHGVKSKPRSTEYRKGKRNFIRCSNKTIKWRQQVMCKHSVQKVRGFTTFWTHADYNNTTDLRDLKMLILTLSFGIGRVQLKCDGTRWRTGGEGKGKLANGVGRGEFRPRQTRQLPRAADLKGRLISCKSY
jgi:hypothetical protein